MGHRRYTARTMFRDSCVTICILTRVSQMSRLCVFDSQCFVAHLHSASFLSSDTTFVSPTWRCRTNSCRTVVVTISIFTYSFCMSVYLPHATLQTIVSSHWYQLFYSTWKRFIDLLEVTWVVYLYYLYYLWTHYPFLRSYSTFKI